MEVCRGCIMISNCSVSTLMSNKCPCVNCLIKVVCGSDCDDYKNFREYIHQLRRNRGGK